MSESLIVEIGGYLYYFVDMSLGSKDYHYSIRNKVTSLFVGRIYNYQNQWTYEQMTSRDQTLEELLSICEFMAELP